MSYTRVQWLSPSKTMLFFLIFLWCIFLCRPPEPYKITSKWQYMHLLNKIKLEKSIKEPHVTQIFLKNCRRIIFGHISTIIGQRWWTPPVRIPFLRGRDIMIKSFTVVVTHSTILVEKSRCVTKMFIFDDMIKLKCFKSSTSFL